MAVLSILAPAFAAGFSVAASPGAVNLLGLRWGLQRGARTALGIGLGAATVDTFYMALSLAGVLPLLAAADWLESVLMFVGGGVLVLLGANSVRSGYANGAREEIAPAQGTLDRAPYALGVSVTLVNPSTIAAWLAISGGILASADLGSGGIPEGIGGALAVAGVFAGSASWFVILAVIVAVLRRRAGEAHLRIVGIAAGAVLAGLGVLLLAKGAAAVLA
jgi:threonine/homoserine/homoserine lactone efflux protein